MTTPNLPTAPESPRAIGWWLHPLLVAAFPVVFLFAANMTEQLSLQQLWMPLGIVIGAAAACLVITIVIGHLFGIGRARSSLIASLLILLAMTYGHAWNLVAELVGAHWVLLIAWGLAGVAGIVVITRLRTGAVSRLTTGLTVAAGALVLVNLVPIADLALRTSSLSEQAPEGSAAGEPVTGGTRDVWYLIFDRYAGSPGLEQTFGFDNGPFLQELRDRGFRVAEHATANYLKTALSLTSSLNMEELDADALAAEASAPDDWTPTYRRLQTSHAVERFLHARGYRYIHLGSRRGPTYTNEAADVTYLLGSTSEFSSVLADTTILVAFQSILPEELATGAAVVYPAQTLYQFAELERLAGAPGLNFVFAHLLVPHPPYAFNADGSRVTDEQRASRSKDEQYLEQLQFANARILTLVDRLHAGPPETWPIVVLAADEGPFPQRYADDEDDFQWLEATPDELLRKFSILTAISVPGVDDAGLDAAGFTDTLTPVNLFRVVFNAAFDAELPLLPERNWVFVTQRDLYHFVDITDRIHR